MSQIREEVSFTKGRIIVRGKLVSRGKGKRADYILYYKPNIPIALIEAKDNMHSVGDGMQQGLEYAGGNGRAQGEVIEVTGQALDPNCRPLPGCVVEIWQANIHGRYSHPRDEGKGRSLDPNFQGYARIPTDKDGRYRFLTIIPGSYAAMGDWIRPPHIHFKVHPPFNPSVTTQMYFAGHPLNAKDLLLAPLSPAQRTALEVGFDTVRADGIRTGTFNLAVGPGWVPPAGVVVPGGG